MSLLKKLYAACADEHLMMLFQRGQNTACEVLYERYAHRLLHYFYRMLGFNESKAQDCLQEVFFKVVEKADTFREDGIFARWIFTMAYNKCKNEYRNRHTKLQALERFAAESDSMPETTISETVHQREFIAALNKELSQLNEQKKSIFLLRFQENFSIRQIAHIVDCPEGTVKSSLFYITKSLAQKLHYFNPTGDNTL